MTSYCLQCLIAVAFNWDLAFSVDYPALLSLSIVSSVDFGFSGLFDLTILAEPLCPLFTPLLDTLSVCLRVNRTTAHDQVDAGAPYNALN